MFVCFCIVRVHVDFHYQCVHQTRGQAQVATISDTRSLAECPGDLHPWVHSCPGPTRWPPGASCFRPPPGDLCGMPEGYKTAPAPRCSVVGLGPCSPPPPDPKCSVEGLGVRGCPAPRCSVEGRPGGTRLSRPQVLCGRPGGTRLPPYV